MNVEKFLKICKEKVAQYETELLNYDLACPEHCSTDDVYVVWSTKVLQNNKALLATNKPVQTYYEATYNGDKGELYLDAYRKLENQSFKID
ncbi:DUF6275 family protein [Ligilactobacillus equi]|uniref:Uncharacterized protein n=1 Tax=Ligilactobacillus equi DPC 6820 TaxID=1392007 RepID=V7HW70_9LACO|nr:DUF6275 family protein [Ligilactobacillus equi]ETA74152.1 hypothetical protein LEQ_0531 [Ligilactobacillus equi DPC 6820]